MTTWADLFERAAAFDVSPDAIPDALRNRRESPSDDEADTEGRDGEDTRSSAPPESSPVRVAADADVLAADLLVGGDARRALDRLREHSWTTLVASDPLLDDTESILRDLGDADLAADWREKVETLREPVDHRRGNHPALASAKRGGAMHVLSMDDRLLTPSVAVTVRSRVETSVRHPKAFAALFDADSLYRAVHGDGADYPGSDRDPRA